ncbi:MAG: HAD family phosphatase [Stomatobaculum sp.]|nr:HAD family phosphatase [Stomatobaculum sp.]
MDYKVIAFDMDGTLLTPDKRISPECMAAIREAEAAGKIVIICSGRSPSELREYMEILPEVHYICSTAGALFYDAWEKRVLSMHHFEQAVAEELIEILLSFGEAAVSILTVGPQAYTSPPQCDHVDRYLEAEFQPLFSDYMVHVPDLLKVARENPGKVLKFGSYFRSRAEKEEAAKRIEHLADYLEITRSLGEDIECTLRGINKGTGLRDFNALSGIPLSEIIMVGDSDNDLAALKIAGLSLAMGNGTKEVKEIADAVLPDNAHDGAAWAIRKYLL